MRIFGLIIFLCLPAVLKAQYYIGSKAGLAIFGDKTESGFGNIYSGVFLEKLKGVYVSPYFNAGYVPEASFGSGLFSFIALEPGASLCLQSRFVQLRFNASMYKFFAMEIRGWRSGGEVMFMPSIGIGTGRVFKKIDAGIYAGNSLYTGHDEWEDLYSGYLMIGGDISFLFGKGIKL